MAMILKYIKPRSTARITIIGFSISQHFLKCFKFCSLNIADFFARSQIKVDLQLKRFFKIRLGPAFPLLRPHFNNMSCFSGFFLTYPTVLFQDHFYSISILLIFFTNPKILILQVTWMTQHRIHVQQTYLVYHQKYRPLQPKINESICRITIQLLSLDMDASFQDTE